MDFDGDGVQDIIGGSGSGQIRLFCGTATGLFMPGKLITDKDDQPLNVEGHPGKKRSTPFAADWDGDGDSDILCGDSSGSVWLFVNAGTKQNFAFSERQQVSCAGGPVKRYGFSQPVMADWDQDGKSDLLVADYWGSIVWYRNEAATSSASPSFAKPVVLIEPYTDEREKKEGVKADCPFRNFRFTVADCDGDGLLDLVIADERKNASRRSSGPTEAEHAKIDSMKKRNDVIAKELKAIRDRAWKNNLKDFKKDEFDLTEKEMADLKERVLAAIRKDDRYRPLQRESDRLNERIGILTDPPYNVSWLWFARGVRPVKDDADTKPK
ncbi:MAG: VCBS repeat-containing protein [Planctomycetes bacterium]|nr:VCBS repeat-containing protein [Planctomycetota bacterium]